MRKYIAMFLALILALGALIVPTMVLADEEGISVGDYWEYEIEEIDFEGMEIALSFKMKVDGTSEMQIGGESTEIFNVKTTGSADFSGSMGEFGDMSMKGSISGTEKRIAETFSVVSSSMEMSFEISGEVEGIDISMDMVMTLVTSYSPFMDDYIGDNLLEVGTTVISNYSAAISETLKIGDVEESDEDEYEGETTLEIVESGLTVTVPAGTFTDCYKVEATIEMDGFIETSTYYYSEEVGNYIKIVGQFGGLTEFSGEEIVLKSYGHGEGILAMFTGENLWITILLIVVIIAIIAAVAIAMRRRKRGAMPVSIPPEAPQSGLTQVPPPEQPIKPPE